MNYPHPIIAREGWPFIAIAAVVAVLIQAIGGFGFAWPFWLLTIFVVQFFVTAPGRFPFSRTPCCVCRRPNRCRGNRATILMRVAKR